jgi:cysteine synthase B
MATGTSTPRRCHNGTTSGADEDDASHVDELVYVSQDDAEDMCRRMAREEGIFAGISAAGACWVAQQIAQQVENATIAFIVCDRGDRYLSTGVFPA